MFWHTRTLYQSNAITIGQAIKFNLPAHGLLGSLILRFDGIIGATYGQAGGDWRIIDKISKIIVQHGSSPIVSVTGLEAHALAALDQNLIPPDTWRNYGSAQQWCYCLVNFGRYLYDPQMGLDLGAWDNVQLIIENTAVLNTDLASLNVTVCGIFAEDPGPRQFGGYLSKLEWRAWPTVQNETIYSILPEEDIIRRIVLQAIPPVAAVTFLATAAMYSEMYNVKLFFDTGKIEVYNDSIEMLIRENLWANYGYWVSAFTAYQAADRAFDIGLGYVLGHAVGAGSDNDAAAAVIPSLSLGFNRGTQKKEVAEANHPSEGLMLGMAPFNSAWLQFDQDPEPSTWLDPKARASVTLDIWTRNAALVAGGRNAIVLDLFKRY
jgi:hypothetical protein